MEYPINIVLNNHQNIKASNSVQDINIWAYKPLCKKRSIDLDIWKYLTFPTDHYQSPSILDILSVKAVKGRGRFISLFILFTWLLNASSSLLKKKIGTFSWAPSLERLTCEEPAKKQQVWQWCQVLDKMRKSYAFWEEPSFLGIPTAN